MEKKRYWLKLDKDFLKSSQIKVIKNMPNGKDYIIFYLALLLESVETIGHLRFSDLVPYSEEMLASITDTNVDIVRSATKILIGLGLMEKLDDGTIFMTQVAQMTGKESESAERVRLYRAREKEKILLQCNEDVTKSNDNKEKQSTEYKEQNTENKVQSTEKNKKEEKDSKKKSERKDSESKKKYGTYKHVELSDKELESLKKDYALNYQSLIDYLDMYIEEKGYKSKSHYLAIKRWVVDAIPKPKQNQLNSKKTFDEVFEGALK